MRKLIVASMIVVFGWAMLSLNSGAQDKAKHSIKDVMKACMAKGGPGLCGKVAGGTASEEEKKMFVEYVTALAANKPPKGEDASWKEKTSALLAAAKDCAAGKAGATDALKAAANCMGCHSAHKGK
jgi:hypothetical protein